jgi:CPA2 family monovalent cation:H+ antiporter-2
LVADMLKTHHKPFLGVDADPDMISTALRAGYPALFGNAMSGHVLNRLHLDKATCVILTMDEPHAAQRLVKKLRSQYPDLPILVRARDSLHAAALYRAGATHATPETLEATLQLSEAVLVELGVPMGFVIASVHEKRDEFRDQIMEQGGLSERPKLKSAALRDKVSS